MERWARKLLLFAALSVIARRTFAQDLNIGNARPCQQSGADPDPNNAEDNLSCPNVNPNILMCYSRAQLCDGSTFCNGGSDEGANLVALECANSRFACTPGVFVTLDQLCDGDANCVNGDDETTTICENKCLLPYYGGCRYSRQCVTSEFDVNCGACLPGFFDTNPTSAGCIVGIQIEQSTYSVNENDGTVEICARLISTDGTQPGSQVRLDISQLITVPIPAVLSTFNLATAQQATAGLDYTTTSVPITLSGGAPRSCFNVPITSDLILDANEQFGVTLTTSSNNATVRIISSAVVTIIDVPVAVPFRLTLRSTSVVESQGPVQAVVTPISAIPATVVINLFTSPGSATDQVDYVGIASGTRLLTFVAGQTTEQTVNIAIIDDTLIEATEAFNVQANSNDGRVTINGSPNGFVVANIIDDDAIVPFRLTLRSTSVVESQGPVQAIIAPISAIPANLVTPLIINLFTSSGTAADQVDYFGIASGTRLLTFVAGQVTEQIVNIAIIDDTLIESTESFNVQANSLINDGRITINGSPNGFVVANIIDDDEIITVRLVPSTTTGITTYNVNEPDGTVEVCVEVISGTLSGSQTAPVTLSTTVQGSNTATANLDFSPVSQPLVFNAANSGQMMCVNIPIIDDTLCEGTEQFTVTLTSNLQNVQIAPGSASGTVNIIDNDVAVIGAVVIDPPGNANNVTECANEEVSVQLNFRTNVQKAPGRSCVITYQTADVTATAGEDYTAVNGQCTFSSTSQSCNFQVPIMDDFNEEGVESFNIMFTSNNPSACTVQDSSISIYIIDDEDCPNEPCETNEVCTELRCPNNFTCTPVGGFGDDPHFAVGLPDGKLLCYTVQGEHGFAFNLISNQRLYMNAMFVPDAKREEVTWLGNMGIVINHHSYKKTNITRLRFEAVKNLIHIDDQMHLEARNIEKLTFENGKLVISEAPPVDGYKQPMVRINLVDVELSFSIKFMTEHLDLYWHSTGQKLTNSHGLIGQFFRNGVFVDNVRKIVILPGKEPVPVQRKPVWAFMERERSSDDSQFCWTAMNPGYQGEGLIDGAYTDYLVDDVLSTEFRFNKLKKAF